MRHLTLRVFLFSFSFSPYFLWKYYFVHHFGGGVREAVLDRTGDAGRIVFLREGSGSSYSGAWWDVWEVSVHWR